MDRRHRHARAAGRRAPAPSACATSPSVSAADVRLGHVGLDHLTWEYSVHAGGEDVLPKLLAADIGLPPALLRRLGAVPSYYLRYFYEHDAAEEVAAIEEALLEMYADPTLTEEPSLLKHRGGATPLPRAVGS